MRSTAAAGHPDDEKSVATEENEIIFRTPAPPRPRTLESREDSFFSFRSLASAKPRQSLPRPATTLPTPSSPDSPSQEARKSVEITRRASMAERPTVDSRRPTSGRPGTSSELPVPQILTCHRSLVVLLLLLLIPLAHSLSLPPLPICPSHRRCPALSLSLSPLGSPRHANPFRRVLERQRRRDSRASLDGSAHLREERPRSRGRERRRITWALSAMCLVWTVEEVCDAASNRLESHRVTLWSFLF
jgi:hypothetical protein